MRIAIIGASGKVGRQALQSLLLNNTDPNLELILIANSSDRIHGIIADIRSTMPLKRKLTDSSFVEPLLVVSNNLSNIKDANLVVMCAGQWPTESQKEEFSKSDPTGRLVQSFTNLGMVREVTIKIHDSAPDCHVLVVTNQSDMMAEVSRQSFDPLKVLGVGGMIDTARFRMLLERERNTNRLEDMGTDIKFGHHVVGYHNDKAIPLLSSMKYLPDTQRLASLTREMRAFGSDVSKLQKDFNFPHMNSGASILPGYAVFASIMAYSGQIDPIEESFNIVLSDEMASLYGVVSGRALSVPILFGNGDYTPVDNYEVSAVEKSNLRTAQDSFYEDLSKLKLGTNPRLNDAPKKHDTPANKIC